MAQINFRIDDETKRAAEALFKSLGLTMSSAITVFLNQSINERGIPFKVHAPDPSAPRPVLHPKSRDCVFSVAVHCPSTAGKPDSPHQREQSASVTGPSTR